MSMVWVAVGIYGKERIYSVKPTRTIHNTWHVEVWDNVVELPKGSIKKLIGRELTWEDDPVRLE